MPESKAAFLSNDISKLADRIGHRGLVNRAVVIQGCESNGEVLHIEHMFDVQTEVLILRNH